MAYVLVAPLVEALRSRSRSVSLSKPSLNHLNKVSAGNTYFLINHSSNECSLIALSKSTIAPFQKLILFIKNSKNKKSRNFLEKRISKRF